MNPDALLLIKLKIVRIAINKTLTTGETNKQEKKYYDEIEPCFCNMKIGTT